MIMYTNTSMVHMGIITHHSPLYEGNDQVVMAIQTFIIPLHSFNTSNGSIGFCCVIMLLEIYTVAEQLFVSMSHCKIGMCTIPNLALEIPFAVKTDSKCVESVLQVW